MSNKIEIPVKGMDCAGCARNVQSTLENLSGVQSAEVLLSAEKARLITDSPSPDRLTIKKAVEDIGYHVPIVDQEAEEDEQEGQALAQKSFRLFGMVFGGILFIVVAGEWLGLFQTVTASIPFWAGTLFVLATGYPVFKQVIVA